ncbi:MAG: HprK-related kinase B [Pseudomonadota bacterium]
MKQEQDGFSAIASSVSCGFPVSATLKLKFGDCRIGLRSNSEPLVEKLRGYYRDYILGHEPVDITIDAYETPPPLVEREFIVKPPDPGKNKIKEEYVDFPSGRIVRKRLTGMLFLFGGCTNIAVGQCVENYNQVVNFINNRFIQWLLYRGGRLFHAAAVAVDGRGLALAGFSGMGKSTLALHLMSEGAKFVSNDRLLLMNHKGGTHMCGVPKLPRINPGTALNNDRLAGVMSPEDVERFARLDANELFHLEHKYDVILEECFGANSMIQKAAMLALVVINWGGSRQPTTLKKVNLEERADLFPAFMKSPGLFFQDLGSTPLDYSEAAYLKSLEGCPVYELSGGTDFVSGTKLCRAILRRDLL